MERPTVIGPLARDLALREQIQKDRVEEFYNHNHGKSGKFAPGPGGGSSKGPNGKLVGSPKTQSKGSSFTSSVKTAGEITPELTASLDHAGQAIDNVHRSPAPVTLSETTRVLGRGTNGLYRPGSKHIEITKALGPRSRISTRRSGVIIHEYGHHLDHSIGDPSVKDQRFIAAVQNSNGYKYLLARQALKVATLPIKGPVGIAHTPASIRYALNKRELFARAYTQWVATKSNDPVVQKEFKRTPRAWRWSDKDFAPIGKELDRIFAAQGLLK